MYEVKFIKNNEALIDLHSESKDFENDIFYLADIIHQAIEDEFGELDIDELMKHKSSDLYALYELYTLKEELNSTELAFEDVYANNQENVYIDTEDGCVVVTSSFRRDRNNYDISFILQKTM